MRKLWISLMVGIGIVMMWGVASLGKGSTRGRKREEKAVVQEARAEEDGTVGRG